MAVAQPRQEAFAARQPVPVVVTTAASAFRASTSKCVAREGRAASSALRALLVIQCSLRATEVSVCQGQWAVQAVARLEARPAAQLVEGEAELLVGAAEWGAELEVSRRSTAAIVIPPRVLGAAPRAACASLRPCRVGAAPKVPDARRAARVTPVSLVRVSPVQAASTSGRGRVRQARRFPCAESTAASVRRALQSGRPAPTAAVRLRCATREPAPMAAATARRASIASHQMEAPSGRTPSAALEPLGAPASAV